MFKPKISIIIPTYNRAETIERAINSVLHQTYQNWELIIVDDASTDDTENVIRPYLNEKIKYYKNLNNKQKSYTRNFGVSKSLGCYLAFLDSDDEWLSDKLQRQILSLKEGVYDGCFTGANIIRGNRINTTKFPKLKESLLLDVLKNNISLFVGSSLLVKKELFDDVGGFLENMTVNEDIDLVVRMAVLGNFVVVEEALLNVYDDGTSRKASRIVDAKEKLLIQNESIIDTLGTNDKKIIFSKQYISIARAYAVEKDNKKAFEYLKKSLRYKFVFSAKYKILPFETYFVILLLALRNLFSPKSS